MYTFACEAASFLFDKAIELGASHAAEAVITLGVGWAVGRLWGKSAEAEQLKAQREAEPHVASIADSLGRLTKMTESLQNEIAAQRQQLATKDREIAALRAALEEAQKKSPPHAHAAVKSGSLPFHTAHDTAPTPRQTPLLRPTI